MTRHRYNLVLAVYVTSRGMAHVLFEGEGNPVDWRVYATQGAFQNHRYVDRFIGLIEQFRPDLVVLPDPGDMEKRGSHRPARLARAFAAHAEGHAVPFVTRSRLDVLTTFAHLTPCTKQTIAAEIIGMIPYLGQHTPRKRMPWMNEDRRMSLFDAAALAISYFAEQNQQDRDTAA